MNSIYGLQYDYIKENEMYLLFTREEGLASQDLSALQVKMLEANQVPKLVPLEIEEMDFKVKLRYNLTGKKQLNHALRGQKIREIEFYRFLFSVASVLEDSKNYMLQEHQLLLQQDFMFIGRDFTDVFLIYLPVEALVNKEPIQDDLRGLIINMLSSVQQVGGNLQALILYLSDPSFSLSGFKKILLKMLNLLEEPLISYSAPSVVSNTEDPNNKSNGYFMVTETEEVAASQDAAVFSQNSVATSQKSVTTSKEVAQPLTKLEPLSSRSKTYLYCGAVFSSAMVWKLYLDNPSEGLLYISFGMTILFANIVFILMKVWRPGKKSFEPIAISKGNHDKNGGKEGKTTTKENVESNRFTKRDIEPKVLIHSSSQGNQQQAPTFQTNQYEDIQLNTTLLGYSQPDATVLLSQEEFTQGAIDVESNKINPREPEAFLEVHKDGRLERIQIKGNSFIIGRNFEMVHFVEEGPGISRAHVEILRQGQEFQVRDLGSRNGTYINEEPLIPNKLYTITIGDILRVARLEYTFNLEQQL
jgi:hypothetical protein